MSRVYLLPRHLAKVGKVTKEATWPYLLRCLSKILGKHTRYLNISATQGLAQAIRVERQKGRCMAGEHLAKLMKVGRIRL